MAVNRIGHLLAHKELGSSQPSGAPQGFTFCPVVFIQFQSSQLSALQELYRQAYEQAQARARISQLQRRLFSVWN